ncbi:MAG: hypothetical protein WC048_10850 [Rhizobium sp.]
MTIEITRWQPLNHAGSGIASFNFRIRGVAVRAAMFVKRDDGFGVTMPFTRHRQENGNELTAVGLDYEDLQSVLAAATARHLEDEEPADAGLRRVLGAAENEACEIAGLGA